MERGEKPGHILAQLYRARRLFRGAGFAWVRILEWRRGSRRSESSSCPRRARSRPRWLGSSQRPATAG
eukprot:11666356-Alexandrium_andersonii.AAC.1